MQDLILMKEKKEENIDENKIDDYLKEKQDILIKSGDGITEFRYEFDVVTDEDVEIIDLSQYKVEIKEKQNFLGDLQYFCIACMMIRVMPVSVCTTVVALRKNDYMRVSI